MLPYKQRFAAYAGCFILVTGMVVIYKGYLPIYQAPAVFSEELDRNFVGESKTFESQSSTVLSRPTDRRNEVLAELYDQIQTSSLESRLPDVIGIGVKKCGTGALVQFLNQHPQIRISSTGNAETFFFNKFYSAGLRRYEKMLPNARGCQKILEKTPNYFYSTPAVPDRIKNDVPNAKLILCLCSPVERAYSDFVHETYMKAGSLEKSPSEFAEMFDKAATSYIANFKDVETAKNAFKVRGKRNQEVLESNIFGMSIYYAHILEWTKRFNKSELLVINGDEWLTNPGKLIEEIEDFLQIPKLLTSEDFVRSPTTGFYCLHRWWDAKYTKKGKVLGTVATLPDLGELFCLGSGKGRTRNGVRVMLNQTVEKLQKFYEPFNRKLYTVLNQNFHW